MKSTRRGSARSTSSVTNLSSTTPSTNTSNITLAPAPSSNSKQKKTTKKKRLDREPETKFADFSRVDINVLKKYKKSFKLRTRISKQELVSAVSKHFQDLSVSQEEVIKNFIMYIKPEQGKK